MKPLIILFDENATHPWFSVQKIEREILNLVRMNQNAVVIAPDEFKPGSVNTPALFFFLHEQNNAAEVISRIPHHDEHVYIFPIYGNLMAEWANWKNIEAHLKGRRTIFLGASRRHCRQIRTLFDGGSVERLPYPVEKEFLKPRDHSVHDERIRFVYAGRITPQKNVLELMSTFIKATSFIPEMELHIAGSFHQLGYPFHGYEYDHESFIRNFHKLLNSAAGKIVFHDFLSTDKLCSLFDRCDCAISVSTHHDEDFGLALAQARIRGLPLIVSNWGGHGDYLSGQEVRPVSVVIDEKNIPRPDLPELLKQIITTHQTTDKLREQIREESEIFYPEAWKKRFSEIETSAPSLFKGLSPVYKRYVELSEKGFAFSELFRENYQSDKLYRDIYENFLKD